MTKYTDLITRLEALTGPDREVDAEVWLMTTDGATRSSMFIDHPRGAYTIDETRDAAGMLITVPAYSASLDAAVALCERVLPGMDYAVERQRDYGAFARIWMPGCHDDTVVWSEHAASPAIALCIATLKALEAKEDGDE